MISRKIPSLRQICDEIALRDMLDGQRAVEAVRKDNELELSYVDETEISLDDDDQGAICGDAYEFYLKMENENDAFLPKVQMCTSLRLDCGNEINAERWAQKFNRPAQEEITFTAPVKIYKDHGITRIYALEKNLARASVADKFGSDQDRATVVLKYKADAEGAVKTKKITYENEGMAGNAVKMLRKAINEHSRKALQAEMTAPVIMPALRAG